MTRQGKRTFDNGADPIGLLWRKLRIFFTVDRNAHLHLINRLRILIHFFVN